MLTRVNTEGDSRSSEVQVESLLGWFANRVTPFLSTVRDDDPDAVLRHLQFVPTDFIRRFSEKKHLIASYNIPSSDKVNSSEGEKIEKKASDNDNKENLSCVDNYTAPPTLSNQRNLAAKPFRSVLYFNSGENNVENQRHLFELSVFLALLRRPRGYYENTASWSSLIEKLEELDFLKLLQGNIVRLWNALKQQVVTGFNALRTLVLFCDVMLLFSEHAFRTLPKSEVLHDLIPLTREMWTDSTPQEVKRCALVLSVFLAKYPFLFSIRELCDDLTVLDAPHLLILLASVPDPNLQTETNVELLRKALEVVFVTTVYSIPLVAYFRMDGVFFTTLDVVKHHFASIFYRLFSSVSFEFWGYFTADSLLSATQGMSMYSELWDSFTPSMQLLQRHIESTIATRGFSDTYAITLLNFYVAALAHHMEITELQNQLSRGTPDGCLDSTGREGSTSRRITNSTTGFGGRDNTTTTTTTNNNNNNDNDGDTVVVTGDSGNVAITVDPAVISITNSNEMALSLLSRGWSFICTRIVAVSTLADKALMRSSLILLRSLLTNYPHNLSEIQQLLGFYIPSLLQQFTSTLLTSHLDDLIVTELLYNIIAQFHGILGNAEYVASLLLLPEDLKGIDGSGIATNVALMQFNLFDSMQYSYQKFFPPGKIIESATYIPRGFIQRSPLGLALFVNWLSVVREAIPILECSPVSLMSYDGSSKSLIHWLCEGVFVLLREIQSGVVFFGSTPLLVLVEAVIRLLSAVVYEDDLCDVFSNCAIITQKGHSISACFMLICVIFTTNAPVSLVEDVAGLLGYVVERSREKLFDTMRLHTTTTLKRELSQMLCMELARPPNSSMNVLRLAFLRRLLHFDPPSFHYLISPDDFSRDATGPNLLSIIRDTVRSSHASILEKSEALELLLSLHDHDINLNEAVKLLNITEIDNPPFISGALVATAVRYVSAMLLANFVVERRKLLLEQSQQTNTASAKASAHTKSNVLTSNSTLIRQCINTGSEYLKHCVSFYTDNGKNLRVDDSVNDHTCMRSDSVNQLVNTSQGLRGTFATSSTEASNTFGKSYSFRPLAPLDVVYDARRRLVPLLFGDGFLLRPPASGDDGESCVWINRLASCMEVIRRLTNSLEGLIWLMKEAREPFLIAETLLLLETVLDGVRMMQPTVTSLNGLMWDCLNDWLSCARATVFLRTSSSTEGVLEPGNKRINSLYQSFVKLIVCNQSNLQVVRQGLGVLVAFQPSDFSDKASASQIFQMISDILQQYTTWTLSDSLIGLIGEIGSIFCHLGHLCPTVCALSILENLWSLAVRVSCFIPATAATSILTDLFVHIVDVLGVVLLHWGGSPNYLNHNSIMKLVSALGQFTQSSIFDCTSNFYREQSWHRTWVSLLHLLHITLVSGGNDVSDRTEWFGAVARLAASSPRFCTALSCFNQSGSESLPHLFSWELREMYLCTSIVALLSSLEVTVPLLTPFVRCGFCSLRHLRVRCAAAEETPPRPMSAERPLDVLLLLTVRHQLIFLLQLPLPTRGAVMEDAVVVSLARFHKSSPTAGALVTKVEEQLSFTALRAFIVEELSIIRRNHREVSGTAVLSPEHTPLHRTTPSNVSILADTDCIVGSDATDGHERENIGTHMENLHLACRLFVRHAGQYVRSNTLTLAERQELFRALDKLFCALNRIVHDARQLENCLFLWVQGTLRDLQNLIMKLHSRRQESGDMLTY